MGAPRSRARYSRWAMAATRTGAQGFTARQTGSRTAGAGPGDPVWAPAPPPSPPVGIEMQGPPPPTRIVTGAARLGRRTKLLVKDLERGEIAVIDHLDIDRVSAEELIAAGAVAVLNCQPSSGGSYPNLGPQLLVEAGILLMDLADDSLFDVLADGESVQVVVSGPALSE